MARKRKLLIVGASVRNRAAQDLLVDKVARIKSEPFLYEYIEDNARAHSVSNGEGCAIAASYAAQQEGVTVEYIRLNNYISKKGVFKNSVELLEKIQEADGYIFVSPVYFGDRSSLLFDLFTMMKKKGINLEDKVSGMISVGAKRNGGQETTNIFSLYSLLQLESLVVGNGPPTSQYGGTAVGGNIGTMDNDYFGIMTSMGVGTKVARTVKLLHTRPEPKIKIAFWVLEDFRDKRMVKYLKALIPKLSDKVDWSVLEITENAIHECLACSKCPSRPDKGDYKCVMKSDDLQKIQPALLDSDGVVVCGVSYVDEQKKVSNYQRFVERTRYLRRDDFRLTDRLFCSLSIAEPFADNSYGIRALTSFIRHNSVVYKGINIIDTGDGLLAPDVPGILKKFSDYCGKGSAWRKKNPGQQNKYDAIGY